MKLSAQAIQEFQTIYKKEFGKDINPDQAQALGINLLQLMKLVYKPIKKKYGDVKNGQNN